MVDYIPILIFCVVAWIAACVPLILGRFIAPYSPNPEKQSPYECGFEPFQDARMRFDIKFYLIAVLFILFDLEMAFMFPWAVSLGFLPKEAWWAMMAFLGLLFLGFIYEWRKGALEWT